MRKVLTVLTGVSLYLVLGAQGQCFKWNAGNFGFFDNREYYNMYAEPRTMFGNQVFVAGGFDVDDANSFSAGANFLYEFGSRPTKHNIKPIAYFNHQSENAKVLLGSFPRHENYQLPGVLMHDTFQYYRPNNEGIFIGLHYGRAEQNVWIDWISRQTITDREIFLIGGTGKIVSDKWFARYDFLMSHYACSAANDTTEHIRDNGGGVFLAGYNFTAMTAFDSLSLQTGITGSYDRLRNVYELDTRIGNIWELFATFKGIGVRSVLYLGEGQAQMYGDKLYSARFYERTDFVWQFLRKGRVKGEINFTVHFLPEVIDFGQSMKVYIEIDGKRMLKR
ncbi:MAG: hypothetical protein JXB34_14960 [Bacteroidales bacterium]|nr:hypothetical protein [Bacteroidales bacterium]